MAASTRRLPDSSGSRPSFWKIAVMLLDARLGEEQRGRDGLVRPALRDHREHRPLAIGEAPHAVVLVAAGEQLRDDLRISTVAPAAMRCTDSMNSDTSATRSLSR